MMSIPIKITNVMMDPRLAYQPVKVGSGPRVPGLQGSKGPQDYCVATSLQYFD